MKYKVNDAENQSNIEQRQESFYFNVRAQNVKQINNQSVDQNYSQAESQKNDGAQNKFKNWPDKDIDNRQNQSCAKNKL